MHNSLTPNVIVFRDRACKDVIKVKWGHMNGALIQKADVLSRGGDTRGHGEKAAICKPRREASEETRSVDSCILDFQPPDCDKINFCCFSHLVFGILLWQA